MDKRSKELKVKNFLERNYVHNNKQDNVKKLSQGEEGIMLENKTVNNDKSAKNVCKCTPISCLPHKRS